MAAIRVLHEGASDLYTITQMIEIYDDNIFINYMTLLKKF